MNPDKLFDYLEGKLTPADREQLEEKLMSDAQLRKQFAVAREIHRNGGGSSREVIMPSEDPATVARSGKLGRRIAIACAVLVFLNVLGGLALIAAKNRKTKNFGPKEAEIRQQLAASLGAAAQNALPAPTFTSEQIKITAPSAQWESVAARITAAAESCSGTAAKGLPDESSLTVLVDIPAEREAELRQILVTSGLVPPSATQAPEKSADPAGTNNRVILQIRIAEAGR